MHKIKDKLSHPFHHSHSTDSYTNSSVPTTSDSFSSQPHSYSGPQLGSETNNTTDKNVLKSENDRRKSPKEVILHAIAFPLKAVGKLAFLDRSRSGAYDPILSKTPKHYEAGLLEQNH